MSRGDDSASAVVEEEKHAMTISIQIFMTGRCHARCFSHASCKGMNGPQLVVGILGKSNTHVFRRLSPWESTHTGGGFPCAIVVRTTLSKPVDWVPVASLCQIAHTVVQHGSVFTAGPSPANPYTFQLFKVLRVYSHRRASKVEMYQRVAKAKNA